MAKRKLSTTTKDDVKRAKKAWKADPENAALKAEYKTLKKQLKDGDDKAEPVVEEQEPVVMEEEKDVEQEPASEITVEQVNEAKEAHKAKKKDKGLKTKYKQLKAAFEAQEAAKKNGGESGPAQEADNAEAAVPEDEGKDTLFIANFSWNVDDSDLRGLLKEFVDESEIHQIRWGEDRETRQFKGWGHVQFTTSDAASRALKIHGRELNGRPLRADLEKSKKKPTQNNDNGDGQDNGKAKYKIEPAAAPAPNPDNVDRCFVGNLSFKIDEAQLFGALRKMGSNPVHVFWVTDKTSGQFYGSSFVTFETPESAAMAVACTGAYILGRPVRIEYSPHKNPDRPKSEKDAGPVPDAPSERPAKGTKTAFFGNLSFGIDDAQMTEWCTAQGCTVKEIRWLTHSDTGMFKGAGFVDFANSEDVDKMVKMNGTTFLGRLVRVDYS